jgi:hypothetical protein
MTVHTRLPDAGWLTGRGSSTAAQTELGLQLACIMDSIKEAPPLLLQRSAGMGSGRILAWNAHQISIKSCPRYHRMRRRQTDTIVVASLRITPPLPNFRKCAWTRAAPLY